MFAYYSLLSGKSMKMCASEVVTVLRHQLSKQASWTLEMSTLYILSPYPRFIGLPKMPELLSVTKRHENIKGKSFKFFQMEKYVGIKGMCIL